jgi:hypothetical protein
MAYVETTELDALLSRVREMRHNPAYPDRNAVAYDCYRMFEDLAGRYKEECEMRDRYKRQSDSWRDKALELADETQIAKLKAEAACPCCRGAELLQPCQECHGKGLASVAYDTLRIHYKRSQEVSTELLEALRECLRVLTDMGHGQLVCALDAKVAIGEAEGKRMRITLDMPNTCKCGHSYEQHLDPASPFCESCNVCKCEEFQR